MKKPDFENDTMLARVEFNMESKNFFEPGERHKVFRIGAFDLYTQTKLKMFRLQDDKPKHLLPLAENRSSLSSITYCVEHNIKISNTIYTSSIHKTNGYDTFENLMKAIDWAIMRYGGSNNSRRIYVNNANTYDEYYNSESDFTKDVLS